ncbi:hypothetical protein CGC58_10365 [Capnocytophaga stomatis]|uniref:Uncharacterized protein n=1 Tax=Capnocytophaga stomatis TaxID=1848904 RepID=A0A250G1L9_9FLAO|nr:hypothetical protein CGC58_10365 [Capnocytophaga stomatis]
MENSLCKFFDNRMSVHKNIDKNIQINTLNVLLSIKSTRILLFVERITSQNLLIPPKSTTYFIK